MSAPISQMRLYWRPLGQQERPGEGGSDPGSPHDPTRWAEEGTAPHLFWCRKEGPALEVIRLTAVQGDRWSSGSGSGDKATEPAPWRRRASSPPSLWTAVTGQWPAGPSGQLIWGDGPASAASKSSFLCHTHDRPRHCTCSGPKGGLGDPAGLRRRERGEEGWGAPGALPAASELSPHVPCWLFLWAALREADTSSPHCPARPARLAQVSLPVPVPPLALIAVAFLCCLEPKEPPRDPGGVGCRARHPP